MAKVTYKRDKLKDINGNYIVTPTLADMVYHSDGKTSEDKIAILTDDLGQTNAQLSEKLNKDGEITVGQINKNKGKIDQTFLSESLLQQIAGTSAIYSIPANYSITTNKLAEKSVDYVNTTFFDIKVSSNVLNKNDIYNIGFIYDNDGSLVENDKGCTSHLIRVKEGDTIKTNITWTGIVLDSGDNVIGVKGFNETEYTVPTGGVSYIQNISQGLLNTAMITVNEDLPTNYIAYNMNIKFNKQISDIITEMVKNITVTKSQVDFIGISKSENLFNKDLATDGFIINSANGTETESDGGFITDFIKIEESTNYVIGSTWEGAWYDENKRYLSAKAFGQTTIVSPVNAVYYRMGVNKNLKDKFMMVKGNTLPSTYIPYFERYEFVDEKFASDIKTQILSVYKGLKWACVGDSLTEKNNSTTKSYHDYIADEIGVSNLNYGIGGTGYMRGYDKNNAFYQRINAIADDIDVATIFGSGNDLALFSVLGDITDTTTDTICGCVNVTLDNFFAKFPTIPIGVIAPTPWQTTPTTTSGNQMERYTEKLRLICERRGVPFLDLYHSSNLRPEDETNRNLCFYNSESLDGNGDGVHPNELGHKIIATKIREFLKTLI